MNTIIEKIRAEVERQREEIRPTDTGEMKVVGTPTQLEQGWLNALSWMEKVLDTLQEQPVCEDLEEEIERYQEEHFEYNSEFDSIRLKGDYLPSPQTLANIAHHFYELGRQRKPEVSEELEEEIQHQVYDLLFDLDGVAIKGTSAYASVEDVADIARHFAKWGAEHRGSSEIPKDLEEAAHFYSESDEPLYSPGHRFHWDSDSLFGKQIETTFIAGAKWHKAQSDKELSEKIASAYQLGLADKEKMMMKEAVEGEIINAGYPTKIELNTFYPKFEHGQEVKAIIIK